MSRGLSSCLLAAASIACSSGQGQAEPGEPFKVHDAQFIKGALPGVPPPDGGTSAATGDAGTAEQPFIASFTGKPAGMLQGQTNGVFAGLVDDEAYSVALAMDVGTGYWVVPAGDPEPSAPGKINWKATADLGPEVEPGFHDVSVVPIDEHGHAGVQISTRVCVGSLAFDNLHACIPKRPVPEAVISLSWDVNADLDLQVVTPDGVLVEPKQPNAVKPDDAGVVPEGSGEIDRDSNRSCSTDGIRTENLVWDKVMPHGRYLIYANLYDACKQPAVRFTMSVYTAVDNPDGGTKYLKKWFTRGGELLDFQANGGTARGLYVSEFVFK